eukprot:1383346-Rhodomonas_salina.2
MVNAGRGLTSGMWDQARAARWTTLPSTSSPSTCSTTSGTSQPRLRYCSCAVACGAFAKAWLTMVVVGCGSGRYSGTSMVGGPMLAFGLGYQT